MFNFKKVNCKKVIINAVIVFCVFALTIVIIRIVNHKDKEAVMADLTQNEWEISGIYRDEYGKGHKCETRMVFLEDGTYFSYDVGVEDKEDQQRYQFKIKSDLFGNLKLYCYQDNRVYKGNIVMKNKTEIKDIGVFDANDEGYKKIPIDDTETEEKETTVNNTISNSVVNENLENIKTYPTIQEAKIYDSITYVKYEQDNNESNGAEAIEWLVLEKTENSALLITKQIIDMAEFNTETNADWNQQNTEAYWNSSDLRNWLNNGFYDTAFSYEEQGKIISTKISTPNNPENGTSGGPDTEDKVFCLSSQEAEKYLEGTDYLHPNLTSYALYKFNNFEAKTFMLDYVDKGWWLRTRSDIFKAENINRIKISVRNISGVSDKEHYGIFNGGYLPWALRGVRPAIYVEF